MFGAKRTMPFWRPKRLLLALERALAPHGASSPRDGLVAHAVVVARVRDRLSAEARKKAHFVER